MDRKRQNPRLACGAAVLMLPLVRAALVLVLAGALPATAGTTNVSLYPGTTPSPFSDRNGVNYSRYADISRVTAAEAARDLARIAKVTRSIRVFDTSHPVLSEAKRLGLQVALGTRNELVAAFAAAPPAAFVAEFVLPYADAIRVITVGNETFLGTGADEIPVGTLTAAIGNLRTAVLDAGLDIPVTTNCIWSDLARPAAEGQWEPRHFVLTTNGKTLLDCLDTLYGADALIFVSLYPFLDAVGWHDHPDLPDKPGLLRYALFDNPGMGPDEAANQFDSDYAALRIAMGKESLAHLTVIVGETGWATAGHPYASGPNLAKYWNGYRKWNNDLNLGLTTFFFECFDEPEKSGPAYERHFGLFTSGGVLKPGLILPGSLPPSVRILRPAANARIAKRLRASGSATDDLPPVAGVRYAIAAAPGPRPRWKPAQLSANRSSWRVAERIRTRAKQRTRRIQLQVEASDTFGLVRKMSRRYRLGR